MRGSVVRVVEFRGVKREGSETYIVKGWGKRVW